MNPILRAVTAVAKLVIVLGLFAAPLHSQTPPVERWRAGLNTTKGADDLGLFVARDAAGNVFVAGTTQDVRTGIDWVVRKYAAANGSLLWEKRFNGPGYFDDAPRAIAVDASGNVIVTGYSKQDLDNSDIRTVKYAGADGAILWAVTYNGPANYIDEPTGLVLDAAGNAIVTGFTWTNAAFANYDAYTAKYAAATGALIWEKRYNGPPGLDDKATAVTVDASGNVIVAGTSFGNASNQDYFTVKYAAADGALLWEKRYTSAGTNADGANAVACDSSGNVFVTGKQGGASAGIYTAKYATANGALLWEKVFSFTGSEDAVAAIVDTAGNVIIVGNSNGEAYSAKYAAANGALLWERRYNGPAAGSEFFTAVALDASNNVLVTGYAGYDGLGHEDIYTAKYAAANGAILWEKTYNGTGNGADEAFSVAVDPSGNAIVTGWSGNGSDRDCYTAKYAAANGALLWERRENGLDNNSEEGHAVAIDNAGNVVMTGMALSSATGNFTAYTAKYSATTGAVLWAKSYDDGTQGNGHGNTVAADAAGNVVISANSNGANGRPNIYTAKYAAANGALLWERRYNTPSFDGASPVGVAFAPNGNVIVAGTALNGGDDFYVASYAPSDGAILWETTYTGTGSDLDTATAMAVDSAGNVIVTGNRYTGSGGDYITAKFSAANGALVWAKTYSGPAGGADGAQAVAVDPSGNVVVTGRSDNGAGNADYHTVKYASATGALLWEKRYNGPANGADAAEAIGVDAAGNVFVTGTSRGSANDDIYTAKYAAANGALLWEKRYNGPGNGADRGNALRVDAAGNVVIAGSVTRADGQMDLYVAKYAAADGALIFEAFVDGSGHGDDTLFGANLVYAKHGLALRANGYPVLTSVSKWGTNGDTDALTVFFASSDVTPPTLNLPAPISVTATGPAGAVVNYVASASDPGGSGVASSSFIPPSGSTFPIGITIVNASATDNEGNTSTGSFTVTVTPNPPPAGGSLAVSPATGVHQGDALTLTAAGWTDPDLPLTYQFFLGASALNAAGSSVTLGISAPAAGTYTLKVRVTDSAGSFTDATQPLTVVAFTPIESWRYANFNSFANAGEAADNADWDHDGVLNLVEFAFGTDPTSGASGPGALQYTGTFAGGGTIALTGQPITRSESITGGVDFRALFVRRVGYLAAGLGYTPEFSADLATWQPSAAVPVVLADNGAFQIVSVPYPFFVGGKKARYFRIRVSIAL